MFDKKSESYKLFWFLAIVDKVSDGKSYLTYDELINWMVAEAWYMVCLLYTSSSINRQHQNSQEDLSRIRESLMKDLLSGSLADLTAENLRGSYHVDTAGDMYQVFMVKMDCSMEQVNRTAAGVIQEKIRDIFNHTMTSICCDMVLYFQSYTCLLYTSRCV